MRKTDRKYFVAALIMLVLAFTLAMPMPAQAGKVKLNKTKVTISGGRTCQLKVIGSSRKVTWKSSAPKIATVSKAGKVTGKKKGVATITAKANGKNITKLIAEGKGHNPYNTANAEKLLARLFSLKDFSEFDFKGATEEDEEVMRAVADFISEN